MSTHIKAPFSFMCNIGSTFIKISESAVFFTILIQRLRRKKTPQKTQLNSERICEEPSGSKRSPPCSHFSDVCLSPSLLSCLPAGDELDERWVKHGWSHGRTLQRSHHRSRRGRSGWWDQVRSGMTQYIAFPLCWMETVPKHCTAVYSLVSYQHGLKNAISWWFPVIPCRCCCFFKRRKRKTLQRHKWKKRAENLKYCGHCQVLNGSNYTAPSPPPDFYLLSLSTSPLSPLFLSHSTHRHRTPPPPLALSCSQCSLATGRVKERCGPTDSTTDSWFLYQ